MHVRLTHRGITLSCFVSRDHHLVISHSLLPLSGLNLAPVARLRTTWEKLPNKYEKLFQDLQDLFDPSRNMAKYRNVLSGQNLQPPVIPLFPVIKKDLTFLHEGKCRWALSVLVGTQNGHYVTSCSSSVNLRKWLKSRWAGQLWKAEDDCKGNPSCWPNGLSQHGPCPYVQDSVRELLAVACVG